ncbi:Hypothetical_protein [Hexamita inflata]|uniref:Hypothetical_protein n=1 Tax=Hexamita inflata TaxID=28002 RepID=A0AA86UQ57_9EUKA|nr:Hypothetical protein HINF_LOCUS47972 [Hexamita inflata]
MLFRAAWSCCYSNIFSQQFLDLMQANLNSINTQQSIIIKSDLPFHDFKRKGYKTFTYHLLSSSLNGQIFDLLSPNFDQLDLYCQSPRISSCFKTKLKKDIKHCFGIQ